MTHATPLAESPRAWSPRTFLAWVVLAVLFVLTRAYDAAHVFLWIDDTLSIGPLTPPPLGLWDAIQRGMEWVAAVTNAPAPTLLYQIIYHLAGFDLAWLRALPVLGGIVSGYALYLSMRQLGIAASAIWAAMLCLAVSMPQIVYSQTLHPSIFYAMTTPLQLLAFVRVWRHVNGPGLPRRAVWEIYFLGALSFALFFFNFMCVMVLGLLSLALILKALLSEKPARLRTSSVLLLMVHLGVAALPSLAMAYQRMLQGDAQRAYFAGTYYPDSLLDLPLLAWDFLTYHFNFAYQESLYTPLGPNLAALPFAAMALVGLARCLRMRIMAASFIAATAFVVAAGFLEILPLGGVRHSLTFAPFLWICFALGIEHLPNIAWIGPRRSAVATAALCLLALGLFAVSGSRVYPLRRSAFDVQRIVALAAEHKADTIVAHMDTDLVLASWDIHLGGALERAGLTFVTDYAMPTPRPQRCLLVAYRRAVNPPPAWQSALWDPRIDLAPFADYRCTALEENFGGIRPDAMVVQSIYYPMNGSFIYLLEK